MTETGAFEVRVFRGQENRRRRILVVLGISLTMVLATILVGVLVDFPDGLVGGAIAGFVGALIIEFMPQTAEVRVAPNNVAVANSKDTAQLPRQQLRALLVPRLGLPSLQLRDGDEVKLKGFGGGLWQRPQLRELAAVLRFQW